MFPHNGAKNLKANASGNDGDYINFQEFWIINVHLKEFMQECLMRQWKGRQGAWAERTA